MLDHVSIGVRDIARSKRFYDAVLKPLGGNCLSEDATWLGYGREAITFWITQTESPVPPDAKSGLHFCFETSTRKSVDAFHAAGLPVGGQDHGKPGVREVFGPNYYAAYVLDPDGYRIEAHCGAAES